MGYRVSAPLVITKGETGADLYLYQGATVPSFVKGEELKRLKEEEFVVDESPADEAPARRSTSAK